MVTTNPYDFLNTRIDYLLTIETCQKSIQLIIYCLAVGLLPTICPWATLSDLFFVATSEVKESVDDDDVHNGAGK